MKKMQVTPADCTAGDFQNDVAVVDNFWSGSVNFGQSVFVSQRSSPNCRTTPTKFDCVFPVPYERLHHLIRVRMVAGLKIGDVARNGLLFVAKGLLGHRGNLRRCHSGLAVVLSCYRICYLLFTMLTINRARVVNHIFHVDLPPRDLTSS